MRPMRCLRQSLLSHTRTPGPYAVRTGIHASVSWSSRSVSSARKRRQSPSPLRCVSQKGMASTRRPSCSISASVHTSPNGKSMRGGFPLKRLKNERSGWAASASPRGDCKAFHFARLGGKARALVGVGHARLRRHDDREADPARPVRVEENVALHQPPPLARLSRGHATRMACEDGSTGSSRGCGTSWFPAPCAYPSCAWAALSLCSAQRQECRHRLFSAFDAGLDTGVARRGHRHEAAVDTR
jgi:hypothetical protein